MEKRHKRVRSTSESYDEIRPPILLPEVQNENSLTSETFDCVRDLEHDRADELSQHLTTSDVSVDKCECGLSYDESAIPRGFSMHISRETATYGRLFFMGPDAETAWNLPLDVALELSTGQQDKIRELLSNPSTVECDSGAANLQPVGTNVSKTKTNLQDVSEDETIYMNKNDNPQPAEEWDPHKIWSDQEKLGLIRECIMRILMAGTYENGKSSLAKSLLRNKPHTTAIEDRTVVVDFSPWQVNEETTATVYDLGGHECYQAIAHLFFANSANNLAIIVHKITSTTDYDKTYKWMTDVLTHAPGCAILLALTMVDLVSDEKQILLKQQFKNEILKHLQREIEMLKQSCAQYSGEMLNRLEELAENIANESIIYLLSCLSGFGLNKLHRDLIKMMASGQFKVEFTELSFLLYKDIGLIGKAIKEKEETTHVLPMSTSQATDNVEQPTNLKGMAKSKKKQNMLRRLQKVLVTKIKPSKPSADISSLPKRKEPIIKKDPVEQIGIIKLQYVEKSDIMQRFKLYLPTTNTTEEVNDILNSSLGKLHSLGLMQWYNTPLLQNFVFNDLASFIDMLKCIFQHSIKASFAYDKTTAVMKRMITQIGGKTKYERYLDTLCSQGLLSENLLKILSSQFGFENNTNVLIELLDHLKLIHPIPTEEITTSSREKWLFFPHYVESANIPPGVIGLLQKLTSYEKGYFNIQCRIDGYIPSSFFNLLCVGIYKLLLGGVYDQMREVWKQNLFATVGDTDFHMRHSLNIDTKDVINIQVKCPISQQSVSKAWDIVRVTHQETELLKTTWWPGLITDSTVSCAHCCIRGKDAQHKQRPLEDVINGVCHPREKCSCEVDQHRNKFPQALLYPLPPDKDEAGECIQELREYMEVNCNVEPDAEQETQTQLSDMTHEEEHIYVNLPYQNKVQTETAASEMENDKQESNNHATDTYEVPNQVTTDVEEPEEKGAQGYEVCTEPQQTHTNAVMLNEITKKVSTQMNLQFRALSQQIHITHREDQQRTQQLSEQISHQNQALSMQSHMQHFDLKNQITSEHVAMSQQTTAQNRVLMNEIVEEGQAIVGQADNVATISSVETELQQIVLSGQMCEAERAAAWQGEDASSIAFHLSHPVLRKHQQKLEDHLQADEQMIDKMFAYEVLEYDEKKSVQMDRSELGKVKRILWFVEEKKAEIKFIEALNECAGVNKAMGVVLLNAMDEVDA